MTGPEYRTARKALSLTQEQLGQKLGVSRRTIQNIESDGCYPVMDRAMNDLGREMTNECICSKCGIRHGGRQSLDAGF